MVNPLPVLTTVPTDTWVEATWEGFLTFADDPTLISGRFYYYEGLMRIEMSPLGSAHGRDNTILSNIIILYGALKKIPLVGFTNTSFRKRRLREAQPDLAFYIGENLKLPPHTNAPIDLDVFAAPTLVVEIAATSLADDRDRKLQLYQQMGVVEYWVVDVNVGQTLAFVLTPSTCDVLQTSHVLPGLDIARVDEALKRSLTENDGAISRWMLEIFS